MVKEYKNLIIIFIDTTLYTYTGSNLYTPIENTCYKYLFNTFNKINKTIQDLINYQNKQILQLINNYYNKDIILIGHHPIITIKVKENENKTYILDNLLNLFLNINKKNIYYLCADTHYYQYANILYNNNIIHQYIVGTGGAEKDKLPELKDTNINYYNIDIKFKINDQECSNGFLIINNNNNQLNFKFNGVNKMIGGKNYYKSKYLKYKYKYLALKNN